MAKYTPDEEVRKVEARCHYCGKVVEVHREGWFYDHGDFEACPGSGDRPEAAPEVTDAEVAAAYSAFVQASFGFPGAPAMRAALEAARDA